MSNNTEETRSAEHHKNKGNNFFKRNDYDNAIREYTAAIKQNPRIPVYSCVCSCVIRVCRVFVNGVS